MNVFHKIAIQGLLKNRTRTIVTMIGIILSTGLITATVSFGFSLLDYAADGAAAKYGDWHVAFLDVDSAFAGKRAADSEAGNVIITGNIGYARLEGGANPDKPYLYITEFERETFDALPQTLLSGRLPENSNEVIVPSHVVSDGGVELQIGDTLTLAVGNRVLDGRILGQHDPYSPEETFAVAGEKTYTVVGVCARPALEEYAAPGYTLIAGMDDIGDSERVSVYVSLKDCAKVRSYAAAKAGEYQYAFNNYILRFKGLSDSPSDKVLIAALFAVAVVVIAIIMTGSVFLIYNSFSISLGERVQQIGILFSVGATERQIRGSVLFEGLVLGIISVPFGILAGLGGIRAVILVVGRRFTNVMYSGVVLTLHVSVLVIAGAVVISMVTILISAYIPAKKAASVPIMECIRQTNEVKAAAKDLKTSALSERLYGLEGTLALKNFKRNRKRYRSIVFSLVLSVVLFIATSSFVGYLKQGMAGILTFTTYDIGFGTQDMADEELTALFGRMAAIAGITESSYQSVECCVCDIPVENLSESYREALEKNAGDETVRFLAEVQIIDDAAYLKLLEKAGLAPEEYLSGDESFAEPLKVIACAKMQTGSDEEKGEKKMEEFRDLLSVSQTELFLVPMVNGEVADEKGREAAVAAVEIVPPDIPPTKETWGYTEQSDYFLEIMVPWSLKDRIFPEGVSADVLVKGMTFSTENSKETIRDMQTIIQSENISHAYMLFDSNEIMEENRNWVFIANVFAYTFIVMISLIAVANVFNTISTNIKLRRRELAMLRSVGMADKDFNKMMRFECAFYGMKALAVGLPLALAVSGLIYLALKEDGIVFVVPWASIGISIVGVMLIIFVTMLYSVSKIRKENIIDALRDDMT